MSERPTVLAALIRGKAAQVDTSEDVLTGIAFGVLAWLPPSIGLIRFLEALQPPLEGLDDIVSVDAELWPWWDEHDDVSGAEPDVVLTLTSRTGSRSLLVVECKRGSSKSGTGESDQLLRQAANGALVARDRGVVSFLGVVYLTEHVIEPIDEINASRAEIAARIEHDVPIRWLSWRDLGPILHRAAIETAAVSALTSRLCLDVAACLDRWRLARYGGVSTPTVGPDWKFVTTFEWAAPCAPAWTFDARAT